VRIFGKLMASLSNAVHDIKETIAITHSVTHSLALYKKYKGTIGYDSESLMWPFGINGCDRRRLRDSNGGGAIASLSKIRGAASSFTVHSTTLQPRRIFNTATIFS